LPRRPATYRGSAQTPDLFPAVKGQRRISNHVFMNID
jgi:hypothetical protein